MGRREEATMAEMSSAPRGTSSITRQQVYHFRSRTLSGPTSFMFSHLLKPPQGPFAHRLLFCLPSPMQSPLQHECHRVSFSIPQSKAGLFQYLAASEACDRYPSLLLTSPVIVPSDPKSFLICLALWEDRFPTTDADIREFLPCVSFYRRLSCFRCGFWTQ